MVGKKLFIKNETNDNTTVKRTIELPETKM